MLAQRRHGRLMRVAGKLQAVGLYRVSTAKQEQIGLGFEAQQAFVASPGWTLVSEHSDIASHASVHHRSTVVDRW
jgi:hypothetical protein